ncbi:MAG: hypothetical protein U1F36_14635 [Planctomycetota bacterium]
MSTTLRAVCLLLALASLPGCNGGDDGSTEARATFASFQAALRSGDRDALRDLLTRDCGPAIEPLAEAKGRDASEVMIESAAATGSGTVELHVRDAAGSAGVFVVVRESGRWRVDLVESAARSNGVLKGAGFEVQRGADPSEVRDAVMRHDSLNR